MRRKLIPLLFVALIVPAATLQVASAAPAVPTARVLVHFEKNTSSADQKALIESVGGIETSTIPRLKTAVVSVPLADKEAAVATIESLPGVKYAETDGSVHSSPSGQLSASPQPARKLSPRLYQLSQPSAAEMSSPAQARDVGLPTSGPGSLLRASDGQSLIVYLRPSGSVEAAREAVEATGAKIVNISSRYRELTVAASTEQIQALGQSSAVMSVREALAPVQAAACPSGDAVSEGSTQLNATSARNVFGVNGAGVTVGILSDSYNHLSGAAASILNGELPGVGNPCGFTTPLNLIQDFSSGTDEGRGMEEIVHDLAPGANLSFATAFSGIYGMAANIRSLRTAGAKVIADDVTYYDEPMFQKGPIDSAVDDVTSTGVSYFSSAGNENVVLAGKNIGSYEAPAYRSTTCPAIVTGYLDCHDFNPDPSVVDNGAGYTLANTGQMTIDFQWAQPWNGVSTNLDLFLLNASTGAVLAKSQYNNSSTGEPFEFISYQNTTGAALNVQIVIARLSGSTLPRIKYVLMSAGGITSAEYNTSFSGDIIGPTIIGHNGGENTISMAAVPSWDSTTPESYSSRGPVTYYYGPVNGSTPAAALSSPQVLQKPDLAATDCAQTSFFASLFNGHWIFCGTSAAAPHAAAVAALMLQHNPSLTPAQILTTLKSTASPVTNGGTSDAVGGGLVNALAALGSSYSFSATSYSASESSGNALIMIARSGDTAHAGSISFATANGTAQAGVDYTNTTSVISFAAGQTTKVVSIPILDTHTTAGNKTVALALSSSSSSSALGSPSAATLTIQEDDRSVAFATGSYTVGEGIGTASVSVIRTGSTAASDTLHIFSVAGTAWAGRDYVNISQNITFTAGETTKVISVSIIDENDIREDEAFSLVLSNPTAGVFLGSPSSTTVGIVDNDKPTEGNKSAEGRLISAKISATNLKGNQGKKVFLRYSISPKSRTFSYRLIRKNGKKWQTVTTLKKNGSFLGNYKRSIKQVFGHQAVKVGQYKLKLTVDTNSKNLKFRVK